MGCIVSNFQNILAQFEPLQKRKLESERRISELESEINSSSLFQNKLIAVYCAGSLGRHDFGVLSDLDLFVITKESSLQGEIDSPFCQKLIEINNALGYPRLTERFLKVHLLSENLKAVGAPKDDTENFFTMRMLMLLESKPVANEEIYGSCLSEIVGHYYRDANDDRIFSPTFLVNDLLRYWRTLCLNYEQIRQNPDRPWRKKNINLKFSRMITVFSTVLPLIAMPIRCEGEFLPLTEKTPLERLAYGLDNLGDNGLSSDFQQFMEDYETFLGWKEDDGIDERMKGPSAEKEIAEMANRTSSFLYSALMHENTSLDSRRVLVL